MEIHESTVDKVLDALLDTITFYRSVIKARDQQVMELEMFKEMKEMEVIEKDN